jgi:hypothetical protein
LVVRVETSYKSVRWLAYSQPLFFGLMPLRDEGML